MRKKQDKSLAESLPQKFWPQYETVFMGILPSVATEAKPIKDPEIRSLLINSGVPKSYTEGVIIRSYVNDLRRKRLLPICSGPKGYWVARTEKEIQECIEALRHRIFGIEAAINGLEDLKTRIK